MLIFLMIVLGVLTLLVIAMSATTTDSSPVANAAWANVTKWLITSLVVAIVALTVVQAVWP